MSDEGLFESDSSNMNRIAEEWRTRFRTLFLHKLDSIFEIAKEIKAFHDEYNIDPAIWRASWSVVCKQIVGISYAACSQYEKIHEVFSSPMLDGHQDKLPPKMYVLYLIARAFEVDQRTVLIALDNGTISRAMTQEDAKQLLDAAEKDADVEGPDFLFGDKKKPTRAKPKTYPTYKREGPDPNVPDNLENAFGDAADAEATSVGPEAAPTDTKEVKDGTPVFLDDPLYGSLIKDAGSNKESAICYMVVHNEIKIHGAEIEEEILRQILTARVNYPAFFRVMAEWDNRFQAFPVTIALRELRYK